MQHEACKIERIDIGLVAAARFIADAQAVFHRPPHHVDLTKATAVTDHADIARRRILPFHRGSGSHRKTVDEIDDAVAVGSHETNAVNTAEFDQALLALASFRRAALGKTAAENRSEFHAFGGTFRQYIKYALRGNYDAHMIRRLRQI